MLQKNQRGKSWISDDFYFCSKFYFKVILDEYPVATSVRYFAFFYNDWTLCLLCRNITAGITVVGEYVQVSDNRFVL